jgi:hypothetical protein
MGKWEKKKGDHAKRVIAPAFFFLGELFALGG